MKLHILTLKGNGVFLLNRQITFQNITTSSIHFLHFNYQLIWKVIVAGVCFGLAGYLFSELSHTIKNYSNRLVRVKWLIPVIGGGIIIGLGDR
jgi:H+/Cl- antiporter ClcA